MQHTFGGEHPPHAARAQHADVFADLNPLRSQRTQKAVAIGVVSAQPFGGGGHRVHAAVPRSRFPQRGHGRGQRFLVWDGDVKAVERSKLRQTPGQFLGGNGQQPVGGIHSREGKKPFVNLGRNRVTQRMAD